MRIEAGGPAGAVSHLSVDAAGTLMAAASFDKTLRLYSLPDGVERAVLRPPIGAQQEGELYAAAISPDGKTVFAGGATGGAWDGSFSIYMFDIAQSRLVARLPGLPSPVYDLSISPDGTRLAAGLAKGGIYVWNAHTGQLLFSDANYAGPVRTVAFSAQNLLFTASADGHIRAYGQNGQRLASVAPEPGLRPWGLAASPDGGFIAVAFENDKAGRPEVDVLNTATLAKTFTPDTTGLTGEGLLAVAWAPEKTGGAMLLAGGYARNGQGYVIRRWADFGLGPYTDLAAAHDTVRDIKPLAGGGAVYATEDPGWGRVGADGSVAQPPAPVTADLRPARDAGLGISANGMAVAFQSGQTILKFDAAAHSLTVTPKIDASFKTAVTESPAVTVRNWRDTNGPSVNGVSLRLDPEEYSRSLTILPNGGGFLLGTDTALRRYSPSGKLLAKMPMNAAVWAVTASADGKIAVAALLDGTLHWFGVNADGSLQERATLFAAADNTRWVLFTPDGFFDEADLGGENLVGFHVNLGPNQQPEWVSFSQAFRLFYAPAVVSAALAGNTAPASTAIAAIGDLHDRLIHEPVISITSACILSASSCVPAAASATSSIVAPASATTLKLAVTITDRGLGAGAVDVFVNGRNTSHLAAPVLHNGAAAMSITVPLDPGANQIILRGYDGGNAIYAESAPLSLTRPPTSQPPPQAAGDLYVLAIGIDHFAAPDPGLTLTFAVSDAESFSDIIGDAAKPIYAHTHVTLLTDAQATRSGILSALADVARQAQPADTFLFYIASHGGVNSSDGRFLLIPQDIKDLTSWQTIEQGAITEPAFISALAQIRARDALLFIDTCYSGNVSAASLANVGQETGRYIISAASSAQEALDSYNGRDGVLIYALRQAFSGDAPHDSAGVVGALSLGEYISQRISELALEKNHAQDAEFTAAQSQLISFPIGMVTSK